MPFQPGNKLWQLREFSGAPQCYTSKEELWEECCGYFEWVDNNPLMEQKLFHSNGVITKGSAEKKRAMTKSGLFVFLGIDRKTWAKYGKSEHDLFPVVVKVEEIIFEQKLSGAAADIFNASIIARDLQLADKKDLTSSDNSMTPKTFDDFYGES